MEQIKRLELKILRIKNDLTQRQAAKLLGVSLATYNLIENGNRRGSVDFWNEVQKQFNLTGEEVWNLQKHI